MSTDHQHRAARRFDALRQIKVCGHIRLGASFEDHFFDSETFLLDRAGHCRIKRRVALWNTIEALDELLLEIVPAALELLDGGQCISCRITGIKRAIRQLINEL